MKKSLIALAVAGVVSAPAAFAATSNVDIYGKLHVSVSMFNDQAATAEDMQVSSNASRFGLKGTEDLGGGLAAIWQFETGIDMDETGGSLASRNSFVGLKGGLGTVLIGNHDTPLKLVGRSLDLFGDTIADSRNVMAGGSDTRAKNVVVYMSPSFSGLNFAAAYTNDLAAAAATTGDAVDNSAWNMSVSYANGPLYLGLGYGDGDAHENLGLDTHWRIGAGYTMGSLKFVAQYDSLEDGNATASGTVVGSNGDYDAWMVGASYAMGAMVFKANYMEGESDAAAAIDSTQWTIGVDYNLSKRTTVYALYADGENVALGAGGGSSDRIAPAVAGGDISAFSVGVTDRKSVV